MEEETLASVETMDLTGGALCLDFANTAYGRGDGPLHDRLGEYGDLVTWAERVELFGPGEAARLRSAAKASPAEAESVLGRARAFREALFRLFTADGPARPEDLVRVGEEAGRAASARRLVEAPEGYAFAWPETDRLDRILWPVAQSAADLLTSEEASRVKECALDTCEWLFLDLSRNRSRRWCDMSVCGNRAKARRFSARQKGQEGG